MRRYSWQTGFVILMLLFIGPPMPAAAIEDAIVAIVDDDVITIKDLKDYLNAVYTQLKMDGQYSTEKIQELMTQVQAEGIDRLIDDRLLLNEATALGMEPRREVIDQKINELKARYPSEKAFLDSLAADGFTITDLRQRISDQLKTKNFVETEIQSKLQVNPQEVTDYYAQHPAEFQRPESAEVESIFIPFDENPEKTQEKANEAYGLIMMGKTFSEVADQFSLAPSKSTITRGKMKPEIDDQIFQLKKGDVSWPIESDRGFFLFKIKEKIAGETLPLEEAKDRIAAYLLNEKFREEIKKWLEEKKSKTYIEIKNP